MAQPQVVWKGTVEEVEALTAALQRNCTCERNAAGIRLTTCPGHELFIESQRFVDDLLFARRIAARLQREEWTG